MFPLTCSSQDLSHISPFCLFAGESFGGDTAGGPTGSPIVTRLLASRRIAFASTHRIANVGGTQNLGYTSTIFSPITIPEKGSGRVPAVAFRIPQNCSVASDCTCRCTVRLVRQCVLCSNPDWTVGYYQKNLLAGHFVSSHKPAQTSYIFLPPPPNSSSLCREVAPDID